MKRLLFLAALASLVCALPRPASAISRDLVMINAKAYANHPWRSTPANQTVTCATDWKNLYPTGDYVGLPYNWGGYMTLLTFDQQLAQGYGAGCQPRGAEILACTTGLDCSGFVSKCWEVGHYTTSSIPSISTAIAQSALLPGDCLNLASEHVVLFSHLLANGEPVLYESAGFNVHRNASGGWSHVSGYTPRRYTQITGSTATDPLGCTVNPIVISSFPYSNSRDTTQSICRTLDYCGAAPTKDESGPEFIYQAAFAAPGTLTVSVSDGVGVDIDPHLYSALTYQDCVARNDTTFSVTVDCGTYYLVMDTYVNSSGVEQPGPYTLNATFAANGQACGSSMPVYQPGGKIGDPCGYPGREDLPFCNENLGSEICVYGTSPAFSYCSRACTTNADCPEFAGGCCADIGTGETYCMQQPYCAIAGPDAGVPGPDASTPRPDAATPRPDAATPPGLDASTPPGPDAARPGLDAAAPAGPDAAAPVGPDAAVPPGLDASSIVIPDAAPAGLDASALAGPDASSVVGRDASAEPSDAQDVTAPDAEGTQPPPGTSTGCGCASSGTGTSLALLPLLLALGRRRRV
ncbi:MAG TPA: hypothetical protein VGK67_16575 [Myxococcales bacterium]|jgi:uncharacterized protein (TIGR03382 family)